MPSILDQFAREVERGHVMIRGRAVEARMLGGREELLVREAFLEPEPPLRQIPGKGSLSKAPNYDDPAYNAAKQRRGFQVMAGDLAIACQMVEGWQAKWSRGEDGEDAKAWLRTAADEIIDVLGLAEVNKAYTQLDEVGHGLATRAYAALVGTDPKSVPADQVEILEVDPKAPPSELAIVLAVHERWGQDPTGDWWATRDPAHRAVLIAYEHDARVRGEAKG